MEETSSYSSHTGLSIIISTRCFRKSNAVIAACYCFMLPNDFTLCNLIIPFLQVCLLLISHCSSTSPIVSPSRLIDLTKLCFYRAHFFASVKTATLESSVRNSMPAITDLVATMAPALTLDKGVKDATSHAPALQVCACVCVTFNVLHSLNVCGLGWFD